MGGEIRLPDPPFTHLVRISDEVGVYEHALLTEPRRDHGYCTDDVARALVAVLREPRRTRELERLAGTCLAFLERAQLPDGRFHNRLSTERRWLDEVGADDAIGRALWGLGTAAARSATREQRERALRLFGAAADFRTPWPRSNAFVVLGAVEMLATRRHSASVLGLLEAAAAGLGQVVSDPAWPWPEARLAYANATLAEARLAAGDALGDDQLIAEGLDLLAWLVETETHDDHFSFTPVGGAGPETRRPAFDQQPIEAAAMADACARAFALTGEPHWANAALRAAAWFLGVNDLGVPLLDPFSGGGRDGLTAESANENQGAESTLALITVLQQARVLQAAVRRAARISASTTLAAPTQRSAAP